MDDELLALQYLKLCCEELPFLEVVKVFNEPEFFLEHYSQFDADFCIIDIEMPGMTGLELAKKVEIPIIFTTAYKEFAFDAFELNAVDYIQKPVNKERLQKAIEKTRLVLENGKVRKTILSFNSDRGKVMLSPRQIVYVKTSDIDPRDKFVLLEDGSRLNLKNVSFEKLQELLSAKYFCRINKKELIALKVVERLSGDEILTNIPPTHGDFQSLFLGGSYRNDFIKKQF